MSNKSLNKFIPLLILLIGLSACSAVSTSSTAPAASVPKLPTTSPSQVVSDYLEALKKEDFGKTYEFISSGYAANLDIESYKANIKQSLEKYHWNLLGYQILGAQILGDQALVIAELEVQFKPDNSEKETQKKIRLQYGLNIVEKKWKIAQSNCILNCVSIEDFAGVGSTP